MSTCGFGYEEWTFLIVLQIYCESHKVMWWTKSCGKQLCSLIVLVYERITHYIQNQLLTLSWLSPINSGVVTTIFPRHFHEILKAIYFLRNWRVSGVSSSAWDLIILVCDLLPLGALFFKGVSFLLYKLSNCCCILIEMLVLIDSKMAVIASNLFFLESFHVVMDREAEL